MAMGEEASLVPLVERYGAANIQVLKNAAHVRQNPGMYIGDVGSRGLHHLVYEVVHNSVDEAMAGYCKHIQVTVNVDGSIGVTDDGRGIPVEMHPTEKRPTLELVMCEIGAGGKFSKDTYKVSAGLHGIGIKAVNALSEWTEVQVSRDGKLHRQEYERGVPATPVQEIGVSKATGTKITFRPDPEIFHELQFSYDTLEHRLRELAFLNKGLTIHLKDEASGKQDEFKYDGGIAQFVEYLNRSEEALHKVIYMEADRDDIHVEVAFQYNSGEAESVYSYVNNVHTPVGGTHLSGFRSALTRSINQYASKAGLLKETMNLIGEDFREGLTAIVSVRVPHPQFESQTKIRLNNPEVEGIVNSVVIEFLNRFLEENPAPAKKIVQKILLTAEAREAAAKARKQLKDRKTILSGAGLPGKLMDCTTKNRDESELFMVEGDSAGGSAASGRDSRYQAILPLRGKILNVEKARIDKMLGNEEICSIISAVGTDIAESEDIDKRNYDKIILLTDADVDGSHIRTLILTFLYRQMPKMVAEGHVYLAQPPLYRVIHRKSVRYVQTKEQMDRDLLDRGLADSLLTRKGNGQALDGAKLRGLVEALQPLDHALMILERRGFTLTTLLDHAKSGVLPSYRVFKPGAEKWFHTPDEVQSFCQAEQTGGPEGNGSGTTFEIQELHEVRAIARGLERLKEFGFTPEDLVPPKVLPGQDIPYRFVLKHGDAEKPLLQLRELLAAVREFGEKGLTITRFKGLGEMNPEELWETTLDPQKRTLLQVRLEDVVKADELFRVLMGDKVEPRREFIEKHALEVRNLDV
jgi:DNA gyrase subunit B